MENPVWHIGRPAVPAGTRSSSSAASEPRKTPVSFGLLLNLAAVCNTEDPAVLWGFITRYAPDATPEAAPYLDRLAVHAVAYYRDFVKPTKIYRIPDAAEKGALQALAAALEALPPDAGAEAIQTEIYEVGKRHEYGNLRDWFRMLYEVLLGQSAGPRFGSFVALYGKDETVALISRAVSGERA